jgi:hypothetical protein
VDGDLHGRIVLSLATCDTSSNPFRSELRARDGHWMHHFIDSGASRVIFSIVSTGP